MQLPKLSLEVPAGTDISAAAREAQNVADATGQSIYFRFNAIGCIAEPGGSWTDLAERQNEAQCATVLVFSGGSNDGAPLVMLRDKL